MSQRISVRPRVEILEAREVPALGLDPTFGTGGIALDPVAGARFASVTATAVFPTGETVIVGTAVGELPYGLGGDLAVVRLNPNGTADARFGGGDGVATVSLFPYAQPAAVTVLADGKVLVAGTATPNQGIPWDAFVVRLNADGALDPSFGTGGETFLDFGGMDSVNRMAVQADGKIVLAGSTVPDAGTVFPYATPEAKLVVQRLNANGTTDTTFGTGGRVIVAESGSWTTGGLAVQADGKIVVGGHVTPGYAGQTSGATTELTVHRLNANGIPDTSFGTAGRAATTYNSFLFAYANDLTLLSDGRIVMSGFSSYGQGLLAWFGSNGTVVSQEQFSVLDGGMSSITRVLAMPQGGVMVLDGSEFEYHAAPGVAEEVIEVHAGAGYWSGGVAVGAGGQLVVAGVSKNPNEQFDLNAVGGAVAAYRLTDPGVTASNKTFVVWGTLTEATDETVTLTADVIPVLGPIGITEGTITFREGSTVLGTIQAGAVVPVPEFPSAPYPWVPVGVTVTLAPGIHTITAEYSGTSRWAASSATLNLRVSQPVAVNASLSVSNTAPVVGEPVSLTVTLTRADGLGAPLGGLVTFYDGDTNLGVAAVMLNGVATMSTTTLTAGSHELRAVYGASSGFLSAESAPVLVTVTATKVTTETVLTVTAAVPVVGAPFTLTARVRGNGAAVAGGTVTFTDGSAVLGTAPVGPSGVATYTTALRVGTRTLRAAYSGDASALASNSQAVSVTVGKAPTATSLALSTQTLVLGQGVEMIASVRITAGGAFPVGAVEFRDGSRVVGTGYLDGRGQARHMFEVTAGPHALTAVYLGCSTCDASTSAALAFTSGRVTTTTALTVAVAAPVFGQPQTLTARVTGATSGRVDFFDGQNFIGSAAVSASGVATLTFGSNLGAHRYRAVFAGTDAAETSASGWMSLTVAKAIPTVTLSVAADGSIRATVRAPFAGSPIGTVTFKAGNVVLGTVSVDGNGVATFRPAGRLAPGSYRITAVYGGSSCFLGATSDPFDITV